MDEGLIVEGVLFKDSWYKKEVLLSGRGAIPAVRLGRRSKPVGSPLDGFSSGAGLFPGHTILRIISHH